MRLLAIDLGLRTGFAVYDAGVLVRYSSTRFPSRAALKKAAWGVLREIDAVDRVVAEGDRKLAEIWERAASKQGAEFICIDADRWRGELLFDRERRGAHVAKQSAMDLASLVIDHDEAPRPRGLLTDDVAEAILIGLWACGRPLPR